MDLHHTIPHHTMIYHSFLSAFNPDAQSDGNLETEHLHTHACVIVVLLMKHSLIPYVPNSANNKCVSSFYCLFENERVWAVSSCVPTRNARVCGRERGHSFIEIAEQTTLAESLAPSLSGFSLQLPHSMREGLKAQLQRLFYSLKPN